MFSVVLFFCLPVCQQHYSKSYQWILIKFSEQLGNDIKNNQLNFGADLDHHADCPNGNPAIT